MKKRINPVKLTLLLLIPVLLVGLYFFATQNNEDDECKKVKIEQRYTTEKPLLSELDIYYLLGFENGKSDIIGKTLGQLKIHELEKKLLKNKTIKRAEIYLGIGGVLTIEILQRNPVLRIMPDDKKGYYLAEDGEHIPLSSQFTPDLIPVTGFVNDKIDKNLYAMVGYVNNNSFWKDQIQQFFVYQNQDISFIPNMVNHEVILGDTINLDEKFGKLEIFYKKGLNKIGWDKYKVINLKFKGQVICK